MSAAEDYLLLGLRLGRHVDGLVDAYYGPEELKEQVDAEPLAEAATLVADAEALLGGLEDGWLCDQARGLRTYAGVLAGEELSYSDEVEGCFGVRPQRVGTEVYEAVHEQLDELLPGAGDLAERYEAWREAKNVPEEKVVPAMRDVVEALRARVVDLVELPEDEGLVVEEVRDEPWWAFNYYLGGLRSRVVVNVDTPDICDDLVELASHEVYPGHHTEHAVKEQLFIRERAELEGFPHLPRFSRKGWRRPGRRSSSTTSSWLGSPSCSADTASSTTTRPNARCASRGGRSGGSAWTPP